jgi:transcriptional regulator GlxA family with amidase domain
MTITIGIYLYDEVEVLDFAGPFEVFSTASRVNSRLQPQAPKLFEVMTIANTAHPVVARGGLMVTPSHTIDSHPTLDVLIVPGGVVTAQLEKQSVIDWIARCNLETQITASVCTGAFLLAKAGLLDGKTATTHWEDIPDLRSAFPQVTVLEHRGYVDTGKIVTSAGISAGIGMSLHLVARLASLACTGAAGTGEIAVKTAHQMEFEWQDVG